MRKSLSVVIMLSVTALLSGCMKVVSTDPANGATGVDRIAIITVTFNMDANPATVNSGTLLVKDSLNNLVEGTVSYSNKIATFTPENELAPLMVYTVTIKAGVKDFLGIPMGFHYSFSFTTAEESIYDPGAPVNAVKYSEAAKITLYKDDGSGMLLISNGTVVPGGTKTNFGVKVKGGAYSGSRVFLSDGAGYQVEAKKEGEFYVCDYLVPSDNLLVPILVQVIYPRGDASKEKFMFRTFAGARANQLVRDGVDIMVGKDILASAQGMDLSGITIESLTPAPQAGRDEGCVLRLNDLINLAIDDGIGNIQPPGEVSPTLLLLIGGTLPLDMGIWQMSMADMIDGLAGDFGADMSGLKLDIKPLFLDVHGLPDATTDDVATLDLGLFMAVNPYKDPADPTKWLFPTGVSVYPNNNNTHPQEILVPADVDRLLGNDVAMQGWSLGANLSMDNLSQFVGTLFNGYVTLDAASLPIPLAIPDWSGYPGPAVLQKLNISFNKEGIAFDFRTSTPLLTLNDMRIEYLENGVPTWQMSFDMGFTLDVGTHLAIVRDPYTGKDVVQSFLDIYLTLIPDLAHCHVMKDNLGIGIFDHSTFAVELVETLGAMLPTNKPGTDLMASINMKDFGFSLSSASAQSDAAGRCFLKMVTDEADLKKAGLCFIDTASAK
jgi:hypothetical protein